MRIGVCVKQAPAGSARMDGETGVLIRSSAKGVINPYDLFALAELMCFRSPFLAAYNG